ncbi:MAG: endolytic transglycosylase MltG [Flavobacteriales bacterium]
MKKKKVIFSIVLIMLILVIGVIFFWYKQISSSTAFFNGDKKIVEIYQTDIPSIAQQLLHDSIISNEDDFIAFANLKSMKQVSPGRFEVSKSETLNSIINKLKSGLQSPKRIRIEGVRSIDELSGLLGKELFHDSSAFSEAFYDANILKDNRIDEYQISSLIFPNTYEFYWTVRPEQLFSKLRTYTEEYWTAEKKERAKNIGLSPTEVYILASIVKGETVDRTEAETIAGLYMNRIHDGMKLQADPTLTFESYSGNKERVRLTDASKTSRYNTYEFAGLPPGPIYFTEPFYLDAVLNYKKHNYIYMCAKPGGKSHNFTSSDSQHLANAAAYHRWLNASQIN